MGFWFLKNLQTGKTSSPILTNTLYWHYETLQTTCIRKYIYKLKIWKKLTVNRQSYHPIETLVKDHVHTHESSLKNMRFHGCQIRVENDQRQIFFCNKNSF